MEKGRISKMTDRDISIMWLSWEEELYRIGELMRFLEEIEAEDDIN
jgi:hypothetical protein